MPSITEQLSFSDNDESCPPDGRILFKKPTKRKSEKTVESSDSKSVVKPKKKKETVSKTSLLSFGDDEDEYTWTKANNYFLWNRFSL